MRKIIAAIQTSLDGYVEGHEVGARRDLELLWARRVEGSSAFAVAYRLA